MRLYHFYEYMYASIHIYMVAFNENREVSRFYADGLSDLGHSRNPNR